MSNDARTRMIAGAAQLLARRGLQATSFSEVLELTGAPRGSVYYHFPEGKDQLVAAAVELAGTYALGILERKAGAGAIEVAQHFLGMWRDVLVQSKFEAGCAVVAVTVATESPDLLDHTARVFRAWRARLAALLERGGLAPRVATRFATTLVASAEGAVVLSRAEQSLEPFDLVAADLIARVEAMMPAARPTPRRKSGSAKRPR